MRKGLTFLSSLAFTAVMALPALAAPDANTVIARVNGEDITLGHMIIARASLPEQYQKVDPKVLYDAILDQLIQQTTLGQSHTGDAPQRVKLQLENERRSLLAAEVIETVLAGAVSPAEVQAVYDAKYAEGPGEDEYHAAHILVETEETAKAIKADLDSGANFAETAKEKSTGPSGPGGGDLGWFGLGAMVPEFEAAVVDLAPGQVSDPIKTQFGWHVIILNEKRKKAAPALEAVQEEITSQLQEDAIEARIEELTSKATIERPTTDDITPEILQDTSLLED